MDEAHILAAAGCAAGTVVIADSQLAGRGRTGKRWSSPPRGIWMTIVERPADSSALDVLSLRVGLAAAEVLDAYAAEPVRLKWPNDLYVDDCKLGGVLVEARWRGDRLDWVAIGIGVNVQLPEDQTGAASLEPGSVRADVACWLVQGIRAAAAVSGTLRQDELEQYATRDLARGRLCTEPLRGRVVGIAGSGELLIEIADSIARVRTGSLVLEPRI